MAEDVLQLPLQFLKGVGPRSRSMLLRHFGALDAIRAASVRELAASGVTKRVSG